MPEADHESAGRLMQVLTDARPTPGEDGLSLIELMFAVFLLAVSILALAGVATSSIATVRVARDQQVASDLASAEVEAGRGVDFDSLALATVASPEAPPGTYAAESLVMDTAGPIIHQETLTQSQQTYEVTRWVTHAPNHHSSEEQDPIKRLIIRVSWDDRGTVREVVDSTIVAAADRGLPVPEFDLEPAGALVTFRTTAGTDPVADRKCFTYTVTNRGLADSYAWRFVNAQDSNAIKATDLAQGIYNDTTARKWNARAWFQEVDAGTPDLDTANMMWNSRDESGDKWMETAVRLESRDEAWFTVCVWPDETLALDGDEQEYRIFLRSQFDDTVVEESTLQVDVSDDELILYLHESTVNHTGQWESGHNRKKGNVNYPIMFMDTAAAADTLIHDMDADYDLTGTAGLALTTSETAAVWDYSVDTAQQISSVTVRLYTSTDPSALTFSLRRVSAAGDPEETFTLDSETVTVDSAGADGSFVPVEWQADLATGSSVGVADVLRLVVGCNTTVVSPCHIDFDTSVRQGSVTVIP